MIYKKCSLTIIFAVLSGYFPLVNALPDTSDHILYPVEEEGVDFQTQPVEVFPLQPKFQSGLPVQFTPDSAYRPVTGNNNGAYKVIVSSFGGCLTISGDKVIINNHAYCVEDERSLWLMTKKGELRSQILPSLCLDAGKYFKIGSTVQLAGCSGYTHQQWFWDSGTLRNKANPNFALEYNANDSQLKLMPLSGSSEQQFHW
ncbi:ricin-type beta-trefoil lectin domain protein [Spartinivicinus poritis]|uniref:Ricin-type beta-trefoil lectin domain protein n=1 Tax=Spartinivicinus poritis TaxID=2994640 RepID=A0ABT5UGE0_9GAMM|nr:ricin-type beta-trefoil lectin domain protein [Spartinivicinus sp. A2-2]MDE1465453.1 ricin-type beta-trefoil lectin domain protein [Spartinivicinus sp. A2-2]